MQPGAADLLVFYRNNMMAVGSGRSGYSDIEKQTHGGVVRLFQPGGVKGRELTLRLSGTLGRVVDRWAERQYGAV